MASLNFRGPAIGLAAGFMGSAFFSEAWDRIWCLNSLIPSSSGRSASRSVAGCSSRSRGACDEYPRVGFALRSFASFEQSLRGQSAEPWFTTPIPNLGSRLLYQHPMLATLSIIQRFGLLHKLLVASRVGAGVALCASHRWSLERRCIERTQFAAVGWKRIYDDRFNISRAVPLRSTTAFRGDDNGFLEFPRPRNRANVVCYDAIVRFGPGRGKLGSISRCATVCGGRSGPAIR